MFHLAHSDGKFGDKKGKRRKLSPLLWPTRSDEFCLGHCFGLCKKKRGDRHRRQIAIPVIDVDVLPPHRLINLRLCCEQRKSNRRFYGHSPTISLVYVDEMFICACNSHSLYRIHVGRSDSRYRRIKFYVFATASIAAAEGKATRKPSWRRQKINRKSFHRSLMCFKLLGCEAKWRRLNLNGRRFCLGGLPIAFLRLLDCRFVSASQMAFPPRNWNCFSLATRADISKHKWRGAKRTGKKLPIRAHSFSTVFPARQSKNTGRAVKEY